MKKLKRLPSYPVQEFQNALSEARKISVISHTDMDGIASLRMLKRSPYGSKISSIFLTDTGRRDITPDEEKALLAENPDLVLIVDLAPSNFDQLKRILTGRRGLLVDHHKPKDYSQVAELDARWVTYYVYEESPDIYSTTFLVSELMDDQANSDFLLAALIGDNTLPKLTGYFEYTDEERAKAQVMGLAYKRLGTLTPESPEREKDLLQLRELTLDFALKARDLEELTQRISTDPFVSRIMRETEKDSTQVIEAALKRVAAAGSQTDLLMEFKPTSGFLASGFIYLLDARIKKECPGFRGFLVIAQETGGSWRLEGISTDPDRSAGTIFNRGNIGGGHHNAGGGTIQKASGVSLSQWFEQSVIARA